MRKKKRIVFALLILCMVTFNNHTIQAVNDDEGKIHIELYSIETEGTNY